MLVIPEKQSHWYDRLGQPCFQVPRKDGKGQRDPTVRDARELKLLPSVTSILRVVAKPGLEAWKQEQAILAALTLPRLENEPLEVFAHRVVEDAEAQAGEAADFGRRIHKAIEEWFLTAPGSSIIEPELVPYLQSVTDWALAEIEAIYAAEKVVVNLHEGYAGTLDLHCRLKGIGDAVVDFKTQGVKNGKPEFYDEWFMQLAAYAAAVAREIENVARGETVKGPYLTSIPIMPLVNIVVDSKEPGPIWCHQWPNPEKGWHLFQCAFELWKHQKGYEPQNPARSEP